MRIKWLYVLSVILIIINGCQNVNSKNKWDLASPLNHTLNNPVVATPIQKNDSPSGFMLIENSVVIFISWTEVDKRLVGQLQIFRISGASGSQKDKTSNHPFSGIFDSEKISLNFTGSEWIDEFGGQVWTGALKENVLTLVIPNSDGTLNTAEFHPATVADYNTAVTVLKNEMNDSNNSAKVKKAKEIRAQIEADRLIKEQQAVIDANKSLSAKIQSIPILIEQNTDTVNALNVVLESYTIHFIAPQEKYADIKTASSINPLTDVAISRTESLLGSMKSILGLIESDGGSLDSRQNSLDIYTARLIELKQSIENNFTALKNAVVANTAGTPTAQFTDADLEKAIKSISTEFDRVDKFSKEKHQQADTIYTNSKNLVIDADNWVSSLQPTGQ